MTTRLRSRTVFFVIVFCILLAASSVAGIAWIIDTDAQGYVNLAQKTYPHPSDDVAALITLAQSSNHTLYERNHAIRALGHTADPRALPFLQATYTGEQCRHGKFLCQYELAKAIKRCGGKPTPLTKPVLIDNNRTATTTDDLMGTLSLSFRRIDGTLLAAGEKPATIDRLVAEVTVTWFPKGSLSSQQMHETLMKNIVP